MPPDIEKRLTKMIRDFMWGDTAHPAVGMDTLSTTVERGGKKLLNIKARNEAIDLMQAKRYLNMGESHPTWAKLADSLIRANINKKWDVKEEEAYQNVFLQTLTVNMRGNRDNLPRSIREMLKTTKKYNVIVSPIQLKPKTRLELPIWHHTGLVGMKNLGYNMASARCQRKNHKIKTVGDLLELIKCTNTSINREHKPRKNCRCDSCKNLRSDSCRNPHKCGINARKLLKKLKVEWDPLNLENIGIDQITEGIIKEVCHEDSILFNKNINTGASLCEIF